MKELMLNFQRVITISLWLRNLCLVLNLEINQIFLFSKIVTKAINDIQKIAGLTDLKNSSKIEKITSQYFNIDSGTWYLIML